MKFLPASIALLFLSVLIACGGKVKIGDDEEKVIPISYSVIEKAKWFNRDNISVTINRTGNDLSFTITIKKIENLPLPINKQYKDTLSKTAFRFEIRQNGKTLKSDYMSMQNTLSWHVDSSATAGELCFISDTVNLAAETCMSFGFPLYALHDLKKGKQKLELVFYQDLFVDEVLIKNPHKTDVIHISESRPLLNGKISFEIDMPAIYKTIFYGQGLVLRNDSTFSPAGMDNTIFQSSYPDIYWAIFYPTDKFYVQTDYEKSTDRYEGHDTFNIYHCYPDDSIGIAVYDHDDLSRDDGLGYWQGTLEELSKAKYNKVIRFGPVAHFDLKLKKVGVIN